MSTYTTLGKTIVCNGEWDDDGQPPEVAITVSKDAAGTICIQQGVDTIVVQSPTDDKADGAQLAELIAALKAAQKGGLS